MEKATDKGQIKDYWNQASELSDLENLSSLIHERSIIS